MLTVEQIKNNISNYRIENKTVIDKNTNQPVLDEDKIIEVKTSIMMYKEAKSFYDKRLRGAPENSEYYIEKALKVYGLNGEVNDYSQNKIIREILEKDGFVQMYYGGDDLINSEKFSFMCEPKKDYGLATLNYIAHQKGIDISNLNVSIDLSDFKKNGVSKVSINYEKNPYHRKESIETNKIRNEQSQKIQQSFHHPMANELNELERQKQIAKQNNDEDAYKYAQSNIERIINQNQTTISPEKWDALNNDEKISFIRLKINESKILHDKDAFDYWTSCLNNLEQNKSQTSNPPIETQNDSLDFSVMINQLRNQNNQISLEYQSMFKDGFIDDEELAILIKRLKDLSNNALTIKSMVTDKNQKFMIDSIIEMVDKEKNKMTKMQNGIEEIKNSFGR